MADLSAYVITVIVILFIAAGSSSIFSIAMGNNVANGGVGQTIPFPLLNQTSTYNAQMTNMTNSMAEGTANMGSAATLSNAATGLGVLSQAGTQTILLAFSSLGILLGMIGSIALTLTAIGVPSFVFAFGFMLVSALLVFALLKAVFKWWL
jgi:hypothetical protein